MKKTSFFSSLILVSGMLAHSSIAQTNDRKLQVGINTGINDYHGDLSHKWFDVARAYRGNVGLSVMYNINPWFNAGLMGNYGHFGHHVPGPNSLNTNGMTASLLHVNGQLRLKINNGVWLDENSKWQPYIYAGTGFDRMAKLKKYNEGTLVAGSDWTGNLGAGVTYMITDLIGVNYNLNYAYTNHDRRDGISIGKNDQFMQHSLGVVFNLNTKRKKSGADADGDGVSDKKDKCPNTPAHVTVDATGCPLDSDKDGVADYMDACPNEAGSSANKGCPEIDTEIKDVMNKALEGVQFETGKDIILESSYSRLDAVAAVMKSNSAYLLDINGHTDNVGDAASNMTLSRARAEAVKKYLVSKGVESKRMTANGFGQTMPKASNETSEGRAQNRRVEFELHY